jgi:CheY-like chemotaxis protein
MATHREQRDHVAAGGESCSTPRRRILVAGAAQAIKTLQRALDDDIQVISTQSIDDTLRYLDGGIDLVLCSLRFDDSRMFDLLQIIKASPKTRDVPIICVRISNRPIARGVLDATAKAVQAMGVAAFVDISLLEYRHGPEAANKALHEIILAHL